MPISADILLWDGSHLEDISSISILYSYRYLTETYWCLDLCTIPSIKDKSSAKTDPIWVQVSTSHNNHRVISDELKSIFNLPKIGTHRVRYKKISYIISRIRSYHKRILYDLPLDQLYSIIAKDKLSNVLLPNKITIDDIHKYELTSNFINQLQITWVFRDILGLSCSFNASIRVRVLDDNEKLLTNWIPISHREPKLVPYYNRLPMTIVKQWFLDYDETPATIACKLFRVKTEKDIFEVTSMVSEQIQEVIKRIDNQEIYLYRSMVDRLSQLLRLGVMNK